MDALFQDLRFALRLAWRDKAFAATVVVTLALCVGANTAIFTVVRSVLLRPLPFPDGHRLVLAYDAFPGAGVERAGTSVPNYLDRLTLTEVFESHALFRSRGLDVGESGRAERVVAAEITPSFFGVLGVAPARGRGFTDDEGTMGRNKVAIVSHGYWQGSLGGADLGTGPVLRVNGETYPVVGVMPDDFVFLDPATRVWLPLAFSDVERAEDARYSQNHEQIARLRPGVTLAQAQERIDALNAVNLERAGPLKPLLVNAGYHSRVVAFDDDVVRGVRRALQLLWAGALFVLLIAVVNIMNLVLVRSSGRLRELSTRHALGAGRTRLARQLVTEAVVITLVGAAVGLAVGAAGLSWLTSTSLDGIPRAHEIRLDGFVMAVTLVTALVLGVVIGGVPALQVSGANLGHAIREDGRSDTAGRGTRALRRTLVVAQVALAFVLLIGAGLLLQSFRSLLAIDPGFETAHLLTARVNPPAVRYADDQALGVFVDRAIARVRALPGVASAGVTSSLPLSGNYSSSVVVPEGYAAQGGESVVSPNNIRVTPGLFEAMGVPLLAGRFFTPADVDATPDVVIVDERLARRFWPDKDAIGQRVYEPDSPEDVASPGPRARWMQVVGVVGPVKLEGLVEGEDTRIGAYYRPFAQSPSRGIGFAVRTVGDPVGVAAGLRQVVAELDPELAVFDVLTMPERVERSLQGRRTPMLLAVAFGVVALLLATIGIYGVLAYQVSQRLREFGIRMALGGSGGAIVRLVLNEGVMLVALGLVLGFAGLVLLRPAIGTQLYGVGPLDPLVIGAVIAVLGSAALTATVLPARVAAKVDPANALK